VPLFWLSYRYPTGSFAGAVVIESNALINARMRVALSGADKGLLFLSGDMLDDDSTGLVPVEMHGRLLDQSDLRKLESMLLKKELVARSAPRPKSGPRVRKR
jgi:hypothetical protein